MGVYRHLKAIVDSRTQSITVHRMGPEMCGHGTAVIVVHSCHCDDPKCKARQAIREINAWSERHTGSAAIEGNAP